MKNSIYVKSIIFFVIIFFVSNTLMVIVFLSSFNNSVNITNEEYLIESASIVRKLYSYGLEQGKIKNSASNDRVQVVFYNSIEEIEDKWQKKILLIHKTRLSSDGEVVVRSNDVFILFKLGESYCLIYPLNAEGPITIRVAIVVAALITVSVAVFIVFLGVGTFIKPLLNMSVAARRIAQGNYDVSLETRENKDAIGQLVDDFNAMCKKLSQTEMLRNDFVTGISHEFKTPIQSIFGFANIIKEETSNETHKEYLARISEEADRLSTLSANILQLNRLDNMIDLDYRDIYYLDEQIRQSILLLENKWTEKNITMNIELEKIQITARQDMMKQVFINLLDNAIKNTPDYGKIDILLYKDIDQIVVVIHDSGKGINENDFDRLFEKFYKGDRSRHSSGNGLGLPIVKKIIDLHGYTIQVTNSPTGGAEFTIII